MKKNNIKNQYDFTFIGGGPSTLAFFCYIFQLDYHNHFFNNYNSIILEKTNNFGSGCLGKYGVRTNTPAEGFLKLVHREDKDRGRIKNDNKNNSLKSKEREVKSEVKVIKNDKLKIGISFSDNKKKRSSSNYSELKTNHNSISTNSTSKNKDEKKDGLTNINDKFEIINEAMNEEEDLNLNFECQYDKKRLVLIKEFSEFSKNETYLKLKELGNTPAPLILVGEFLNALGKYIVEFVYKNYNKQILMTNTNVISCRQINSKESKIEFINSENLITKLTSNRTILATGGFPRTDNSFEIIFKKIKNDFYSEKYKIISEQSNNSESLKYEILLQNSDKLSNNSFNDNKYIFLHADSFLSEEGYTLALNYINKYLKSLRLNGMNINEDNKLKVGIIGGSHSSFSCIWLLLNGPCRCLCCNIENHNNCLSWNNAYNHELFCDIIESNENKKSKFDLSNYLDITLYHKSNIKVSYLSKEDAIKDNYTLFDSKSMNTKGRIYPFIGIRADAKELYRKYSNGLEKRFKLIKYSSEKELISHLKNKDLIINAIGYVTNEVKVFNLKNKLYEFRNGVNGGEAINVNKSNNLVLKENIISNKADFIRGINNSKYLENYFGIGQGYSLLAPEIINGKNGRADSIHLYYSVTSKRLFKGLNLKFNTYHNLERLSLINQKSKIIEQNYTIKQLHYKEKVEKINSTSFYNRNKQNSESNDRAMNKIKKNINHDNNLNTKLTVENKENKERKIIVNNKTTDICDEFSNEINKQSSHANLLSCSISSNIQLEKSVHLQNKDILKTNNSNLLDKEDKNSKLLKKGTINMNKHININKRENHLFVKTIKEVNMNDLKVKSLK